LALPMSCDNKLLSGKAIRAKRKMAFLIAIIFLDFLEFKQLLFLYY
jgi:hypothetical protein